MTPQEEIARAGEARQVLEAPIFLAARKNLEEQLQTLRRNAPIKDSDLHTRIILMEQIFGYLMTYFEQIAVTGKMAEVTLRQEEERRSFLDRGLALFQARGRNI